MPWNVLKTPAALVDLDRLEANTVRMSERMGKLGARLRPHVKTHKCAEAARFQVRGHFGGITVSTLAEARHFAKAGFRNITYAVPMTPARLEEAAEIGRGLDELNVLLDHEAMFHEMESFAAANGNPIASFLKVDCGYHRAGVDPEAEASVQLALRMKASPHVRFKGILTHAGHSYDCKNAEEIKVVAEQERAVMVRFAAKLEQAGAPPPDVSVGSTPTMSLGDSLEGITEARPGNYAFYDRFQASIGSCRFADTAFSILVTVNGLYPDRNEVLIDAGALAFSKDSGPTQLDPHCGYGAIFSADGARAYDGLRLSSLSQEHGKIRSTRPIPFEEFAVGTRLRVVPNHSCLAAALFDRYHVLRGEELVDEWRPARGW